RPRDPPARAHGRDRSRATTRALPRRRGLRAGARSRGDPPPARGRGCLDAAAQLDRNRSRTPGGRNRGSARRGARVNGYFITGTDTNVGKTYVTCALARRARGLGQRVFALKPIETGCSPGHDGRLLGPDQELLVAAAGDWQQGELRGLYRFPLPAAPRVAAEAAGAVIDLEAV